MRFTRIDHARSRRRRGFRPARRRRHSPRTSNGSADHDMGGMTMTKAAPMTAADLRVTLDNLFGEHAVLAMNATNAGVTGSKSFPAAAKALDNNSVALSKAIASVYGAKAGQTFLNGKYMWRDHIKFFVNYTVATAKKDKAGQNKAVNEPEAVHRRVRQLPRRRHRPAEARRPQRPARSRPRAQGSARRLRGRQLHAGSGADYHAAYNHMFMTGDLVAGAIAKQKHLK